MNIEVRYLSKSGNTKKVADVIAETAGCKALSIDHAVGKETDILFLGAAVYGAGVDTQMKNFIQGLDGRIKNVVVFSTTAIISSAYPEMSKLLNKKGIPVDKREFHCKGKFTILHKERPNKKDLEDARQFAKSIV